MRNQYKKSGNVYKMSLLPYCDMNCYFLYIDLIKYYPEILYPELVYIFDYFEPNLDVTIQDLLLKNLLINPQFISGSNGLSKIANCLENVPINVENIIPPLRRKKNQHPLLPHNGLWNIIDLFDNVHAKELSFSKVSYLEEYGSLYINLIPFRIMLEFIKLGRINEQEVLAKTEIGFEHSFLMEKTNGMPLFIQNQKLDAKVIINHH